MGSRRGGSHQAYQIRVSSYPVFARLGAHVVLRRYDHGITTFDSANVSAPIRLYQSQVPNISHTQVYSNGLSEKILGNAIKKLELPREELVIMTKVLTSLQLDEFTRSTIPRCFGLLEKLTMTTWSSKVSIRTQSVWQTNMA